MTIRLKLLFLVVLASLPALGLALYSGLAAGDQALRAAERDAAHLSRDLVLRQQQLTASTRQFLTILARLDTVRRLDGQACEPLFRELLAANPVHSDILLSTPQGRLVASARGANPHIDVSDSWHFKEVLRTGGFAVGNYRKSPTTGLDVQACALPVFNANRKLVGVLSSGLRLDSFDDIVRDIQILDGSTVFLADRNGTRLFNRHFPNPQPELYPLGGQVTLKQQGLLETASRQSPFYTNGLDGQRRLYVVQESRLGDGDAPYAYVGVSIPQQTILGQARAALFTSLSLLILAALVASALAWVAGRKLFVERIDRLAQVAGSFAAGDLSARTQLPPPILSSRPDELGRLGQAVDHIGEELSRREAEREATLRRLARTQFAVDHAGEEIFWADEEARLVYVNERAAKNLGYTREELLGMRVFDVDADETGSRWSQLLSLLAASGPVTIETRHRTKSGTIVPKEITISMVDNGDSRLIFGSAHDISERKRHEAVLRSLLDDTATVTGQAFFDVLTSRLVAVLGVHSVFLGEYLDSPATRMRSLSTASREGRLNPRELLLADSPGRDIPDGGHLLASEGAGSRYPGSPYLASMGIEGYLGVPVQDAAGVRMGHLAIMDTQAMPDDPALVSILRLFAQRAAAELTRLRAERATRSSLHEKEVLLKEVHHRVKNNMQIISSLLCLQARDISDPAVLDLLAQSRARILSMALVHEDLYQTGNLAQVDFPHYLKRLAERVATSFASASDVRFELDLHELALAVDQAVPLGLLCNELFTNALKHAFPEQRQGVVLVTLRRSLGEAVISVRDNGQGLPLGFQPGDGATLGLQLVWSLTEQLHGQAKAENDGGAVFTVRFPLSEAAPQGDGPGSGRAR